MMTTLLMVFSWTCLGPSIAFHLIAKLDSYGLGRNLQKYINSYLDNGKQCAHVNNIKSHFNGIISGVLKGSAVGPVLFNAFFNDYFLFKQHATVQNFADKNIHSSFAKTFDKLKEILESETKCNSSLELLCLLILISLKSSLLIKKE